MQFVVYFTFYVRFPSTLALGYYTQRTNYTKWELIKVLAYVRMQMQSQFWEFQYCHYLYCSSNLRVFDISTNSDFF